MISSIVFGRQGWCFASGLFISAALVSCGGGGGGGTARPAGANSRGDPLLLSLESISPLRDSSAVLGETVAFRVEAGSHEPASGPSYSWRIDGNPLGHQADRIELATGGLGAGTHCVSVLMTRGHASATLEWVLKVTEGPGRNRAPLLLQAMPSRLVSIRSGSVFDAAVVAADVDAADTLTYEWRLDRDALAADSRVLHLDTTGLEPGEHTLTVEVRDGLEHPGEPAAEHTWTVQVIRPDEPEPSRICGAWPMGNLRLRSRATARFEVAVCGNEDAAYQWELNGSLQTSSGPTFDLDTAGEEGTLGPGVYLVTCRLLSSTAGTPDPDSDVGWTVYVDPDIEIGPAMDRVDENLEPTAKWLAPQGDVRAIVGTPQCFQASVKDPEADVLSYVWLVNGKAQVTDGPILCWIPSENELESRTQVEVYASDGHPRNESAEHPGGARIATWDVSVGAGEPTFLAATNGSVILDNGGVGTSSTGTWTVSQASGAYGTNSLVASAGGYKYTYNLAVPVAGKYDVSLWWTSWPTREVAAPVSITHKSGTATVKVDQRTNGGQWNKVGTYDFGATAKVVITSVSGTLSTCADAVQLTPVPGTGPAAPPPQAAGQTFVIDDGTPGTSFTGEWLPSSGVGPYGAQSLVGTGVGNRYTFSRALASGGTYDVFAWWTQWATRDPAAVYRITHASGVTDVKVNQTANGGKWNRLGQFSFSSGVQVEVIVPGTLAVCADAVEFVPATASPPPPPGEVIVDNGGTGTSSVGTWSISTAPNPYGTNALFAKTSGSYTFDATLPAAGKYGVYTWYTQTTSRESSVPHDIKHSSGTATVNVDQRTGGAQWKLLGDYTFGTTARVTIRVVDADSVCADAIRFVQRSTQPPPPPPPPANSLVLAWDAPTKNANGSALTDLAGYRVHYKTGSGAFSLLSDVGLGTQYEASGLPAGTYTFVVVAYDRSGNASVFSASVVGTLP